MNSEELEQSLRTEFESHLKDVLADMRQEITAFQEKVQTEIEKHKAQLDSVFQDFSSRIDTEKELDISFTESVVEHLRLARDEGARITAEAIAEAEEMAKETAPPPPQVSFSELRTAVNEISRQTSQAEILKTLVDQAAHFTPRGAFFIVKNNYFVGWRVLGEETSENETAIREIFTPVDSDTILGESVRSLSTVESAYGTYNDDADYLNKLDFGQPDRMYALPLVARGRGVAVLYADYGQEGTNVNVEALEMLVNVAGLTVELLAASSGARPARETTEAKSAEEVQETYEQPEYETAEEFQPAAQEFQPAADEYQPAAENYQSTADEFQPSYQSSVEPEAVSAEEETSYSHGITAEESEEIPQPADDFETVSQPSYWEQPTEISQEETAPEEVPAAETEYQFETATASESGFETPAAKTQSFDTTEAFSSQPMTDDFSAAKEPSFDSFQPQEASTPAAEPVEAVSQPVSAQRVKTRFSERNVDLPIDVSEEERRLHNDARRFARLLVSEIKLYNEQKVKEGREANDLYERLREAIDRSREMYDKRVQPPVAAKFDYFHYELVNTLAEGNEQRLGESYVGAAA